MKRTTFAVRLLTASIALVTFLMCTVLSHAAGAVWEFVCDMGGIQDADNHVEAYCPRNRLLYYFPSWDGVFHGEVFSASAESGFTSWKETRSFPWLPCGTYWGRALIYRSYVYFSGPFGTSDVMKSKIGKDGALGPWQKTTSMPAGFKRRSLHQTVAYRGRFYVLGGWSYDNKPGYTDLLMAPILVGCPISSELNFGNLSS